MAFYRQVGSVPPKRHTQHRDPDGQPLPRGADGGGGLLLGLLAALPPRRAVGDRRQRGLGAARPDPHRPTTRSSRGTSSCTTSRRPATGGRGHRPAAGARQQRRADRLRRRPGPTPRRTTATRSATSASTSRPAPAPSRPSSGCWPTATGDYVVIPRATTHRWVPAEPSRLYPIEANSHVAPPKRYLSRYGQLLEHAPYCERDLHGPAEPLLGRGRGRRGARQAPRPAPGIVGTRMTYATHPFDVVGWDGCLYPYTFNIEDYMPITGKVHQPPPVHQVFEGHNFVVCNFLPRKVDYHELSIPVPYYHSNVDSDEVMFYVGGDYEARKGSGIGLGSISLHPGGYAHGPQPVGDRGLARGRLLRGVRGHGRHLRARSTSARAAWPSRTRRTPGPGPAAGPGRRRQPGGLLQQLSASRRAQRSVRETVASVWRKTRRLPSAVLGT